MSLELPIVDSCFFCEVLTSKARHWSVWADDELTLTLLNGRQFEDGQSIVIPRQTGSDWGFCPPHLAELDRRAANPKFDHTIETPAKRKTAELLRQAGAR